MLFMRKKLPFERQQAVVKPSKTVWLTSLEAIDVQHFRWLNFFGNARFSFPFSLFFVFSIFATCFTFLSQNKKPSEYEAGIPLEGAQRKRPSTNVIIDKIIFHIVFLCGNCERMMIIMYAPLWMLWLSLQSNLVSGVFCLVHEHEENQWNCSFFLILNVWIAFSLSNY